MKNTKDYKTFGIELALKAGKLMQKNFTLGMKKEWKSNDTPLTVTDTAINRFVIEAIGKSYPTHSVIGEEESSLGTSEFSWVCDPLDGTIPYSHGIPTSTFSLALTDKGRPLLGIVYDPFMKRLFVAEKGNGAYLNNKKITVSDKKDFHNSIITIEGLNSPTHTISDFMSELSKRGAKILTLGGFVYSGMLVASGELMAAIYAHQSPWDAAALKVLVEEAGGKCTDLQGNNQLYNKKINGFIASNGHVHEGLVEILSKFAIKTE